MRISLNHTFTISGLAIHDTLRYQIKKKRLGFSKISSMFMHKLFEAYERILTDGKKSHKGKII